MPEDPEVAPTRREGLRVGWIVLLSLLTLLPLITWWEARQVDTPVETVDAFFAAVRDKDLDRAYGYVDGAVPYGEAATFLHPDAIGDDWEVLDVREISGDYSWETEVAVTLGHPEGTAEGRFIVREDDGEEWAIADPFQLVTFAASSQLALQVEDRVVELVNDSTLPTWYASPSREYALLPGIYRFFDGAPVALLEPDGSSDPITIAPPPPEPTPAQIEAVQSAVNDLIDACVAYQVPAPPGCPFATDGEIDTADRDRVGAIEDLQWTVSAYPKATILPGTDYIGDQLLLVGFTEPGRLELTGTGSTDVEGRAPFTAACHFGGAELVVLLRGDDAVELTPIGEPETDTCRGTA